MSQEYTPFENWLAAGAPGSGNKPAERADALISGLIQRAKLFHSLTWKDFQNAHSHLSIEKLDEAQAAFDAHLTDLLGDCAGFLREAATDEAPDAENYLDYGIRTPEFDGITATMNVAAHTDVGNPSPTSESKDLITQAASLASYKGVK